MYSTPEEFLKLPKFLIGDDGDERDFVVHLHYPRFVMEIDMEGECTATWIDKPVFDPANGEVGAQEAKLLHEAGVFFEEQVLDEEEEE